MAGRALDEVAPLVAPAPAKNHLAGEFARQLSVGAVAVADHEHDTGGVAEQGLRDLGAARAVDVECARLTGAVQPVKVRREGEG